MDCCAGFASPAPRNAEAYSTNLPRAANVVDGFNCAPHSLRDGLLRRGLAQIEGYRQRLWNPEKKLLAHIWMTRSAIC